MQKATATVTNIRNEMRRAFRTTWSQKDIRIPEPVENKADPIIAVVVAINNNSGIDLKEIAAGCKISISTLKKWHSGETQKPFHLTVRKLLRFHGLDLKIFQRNETLN